MDEAVSEPDRLAALIACCRKRVARAQEKTAAARDEALAADEALKAAEQRLSDWVAANPDPQATIFEELSNV